MARLKDLISKDTIKKLNESSLGQLPSERLMKMKWNPITDSKPVSGNTTSVNESGFDTYVTIDGRGNIGPKGPKMQLDRYVKNKKGWFAVPEKHARKAQKMYGVMSGAKLQNAMWDLRSENINEAEMDRRFQKEWERSCDVLVKHLDHELRKGPKGQIRAQLQLYAKQVTAAKFVPEKMGKILGTN